MDTGKVHEAWVRISWWYQQARGTQAPPTLEALDEVLTDRAEPYSCRPLEGLKVPILVQQSDIKDDIPTEAEVETAVKGIKGGRAVVPLGMCI